MRHAGTLVSRWPALSAWVVSRLVVLLALAASALVPTATHRSLLAWDAGWYLSIAEHGYAGSGAGAVRFFPFWPLLVHGVSTFTRVPAPVVLVVLANGFALGYVLLAHTVALRTGLTRAAADLVPWLILLAPAGFVTVMGYGEPLFGVLLCIVLITASAGRWRLCALAAFCIGATRPTGTLVLLLLAPTVRHELHRGPARAAAACSAAIAPAIGLATFLLWSRMSLGDAFAPFRAQTAPGLRGGLVVNPVAVIVEGFIELDGGRVGSFIVHLVWVPIVVLLLVVTMRRRPAGESAFAGATVVLALTARNFSSFERYAASALPLVLAAASLLAERRSVIRRSLLAGVAITQFVLAFLAFVGWYLP